MSNLRPRPGTRTKPLQEAQRKLQQKLAQRKQAEQTRGSYKTGDSELDTVILEPGKFKETMKSRIFSTEALLEAREEGRRTLGSRTAYYPKLSFGRRFKLNFQSIFGLRKKTYERLHSSYTKEQAVSDLKDYASEVFKDLNPENRDIGNAFKSLEKSLINKFKGMDEKLENFAQFKTSLDTIFEGLVLLEEVETSSGHEMNIMNDFNQSILEAFGNRDMSLSTLNCINAGKACKKTLLEAEKYSDGFLDLSSMKLELDKALKKS